MTKLGALVPALTAWASHPNHAQLIEEAQALGRAVAAFHMEAIRFRMYSVDRLIRSGGDDPTARALFNELRDELEAAGFHTRSHTAP